MPRCCMLCCTTATFYSPPKWPIKSQLILVCFKNPLPLYGNQMHISNMTGPGNNVTSRAIQSHVQLTKKAMKNKLGATKNSTLLITATHSTPAGPSGGQKRPASAAALTTPSKKPKRVKQETSEEEEEEGESSHGDDSGDEPMAKVKPEETTPPAAGRSSGNGKGKAMFRASRSRSSPRGKLPVNYLKLNDPFTTMEGAMGSDGENVFGEDADTSSEDSSDNGSEREEEMEEV